MRQSKTDVLSSSIRYMKLIHEFPAGKDSDEK